MKNGIHNGVRIIAEVKPWSPRGEQLTENTWYEQLALADQIGCMISVHTHPLWRGSFDLLTKARRMTDKPILAKGFHSTDDEIRRALGKGADAVLVVGRLPGPGVDLEKCYLEPLTLEELKDIPPKIWAVWNSRDLSSLKDLPGIPKFLADRWSKSSNASDRKRESFKAARAARPAGLLCQASNLKTADDIELAADAVLVGSNLESFAASLGITL